MSGDDPRARIDGWLAHFATLSGLRVPPLGGDGSTRLVRGSATVAVNVLAERGFLLLLAPMLETPERHREELYRLLLEASYLRTEEAAFAIDRQTGRVFLRVLRALDGLERESFCELLATVARLADEWDDRLRSQFGG